MIEEGQGEPERDRSGAGDEAPARSVALERAVAILGDRWSLLIVQVLLAGPRRFSTLLRTTPGISANVLTKRLRRLEEQGVLERRSLTPTVDVSVYVLSRWGEALRSSVGELENWASVREQR